MNLKLTQKLFSIIEIIFNKYFLSLVSREKWISQISAAPDISVFDKKIAIVMQGPIVVKQQFTLETLKLYRKRFPEIIIILSTWDSYSKKIIDLFLNEKIYVLQNEIPKNKGVSNINLQIKSTSEGILYAKKLGAEFCLKTRTDQRIYRHDFLLFMDSLIHNFPITDDKIGLRNRLLIPSLNTFKYRLYSPSDMLMYGSIHDMEKFWCIKFDERNLKENPAILLDWTKKAYAEIYLSTTFLKTIRHDFNWTLQDSWDTYKNYYCIFDKDSIDLFWWKYDYVNENRNYTNTKRHMKEEFTFSDWLNIYQNNLKVKKGFDEIISNHNFNDTI